LRAAINAEHKLIRTASVAEAAFNRVERSLGKRRQQKIQGVET
jgi:hypothetical protein